MPFKVDATLISWVDSDSALANVASGWTSVIGLDTEFLRTDTFYPLPGLYQVFDGQRVFLLDPLKINQWQPFTDVLCDPEIVKVMHACSEDLELFNCHLGVAPAGLVDTQLAHAFLTSDYSTSYANLVEHRTGELLDKGATRSDWRQRPLSDTQLQYAAADVWHLPDIYRDMRSQLERLERWSWFLEDMAPRGRYQSVAPVDYYRNVKGAGRLDNPALARLRQLCEWREQQAMERNVPRNRIVRDEHLLSFAGHGRLSIAHVREVLPHGVARRFGDNLLAAHAHGAQAQAPIAPMPVSLSTAQGKLVTKVRELGKAIAQQLGCAPELLARKREVEHGVRHFLQHGNLPPVYEGWRQDLIGREFLSLLSGEVN